MIETDPGKPFQQTALSGAVESGRYKSAAIISITTEGANLALKIKGIVRNSNCYFHHKIKNIEETNHFRFRTLKEVLDEIWHRHDVIIFIMATGIVVRSISRFIRDKKTDPAVLVLDEKGRFVISLLSGHIGGANKWAGYLAEKLGAIPVITTASDVRNKPSLDLMAQVKGLVLGNTTFMSQVMHNLLENYPVWIYDPENIISGELIGSYPCLKEIKSELDNFPVLNYPGIWVSERIPHSEIKCVCLYPRNLVVGIGCNSGTSCDEIVDFIRAVFDKERLALGSIKYFASIDIKRSEKGLIDAVFSLGKEIRFYSMEDLKGVRVPNPSDTVKKYVGVMSVCEAAAMISHQKARLIVPKQKTRNVTLAVAKVPYTLSA